jgi:nitric oxide reductase subunit C
MRIRFLLVSLTIVILLAACGGQAAPAAPTAAPAAPAAPTAAPAAPAAPTAAPAAAAAAAGDAAAGEKLFKAATLGKDNVLGCATCHSVQAGQKLVGPSLAGIATDAQGAWSESGYKGSAKSADDWLREDIVNPNVDVVEGYQPNVMPGTFAQELTPAQISDLVAYLETLK